MKGFLFTENFLHAPSLIENADKITYVNKENYFNGCMQKRNKYMVDNSSVLIAAYDGKSSGGSKSTIDYAKSLNKKILYVDTNI